MKRRDSYTLDGITADVSAPSIEAPFDSDTAPKAIFEPFDNDHSCGKCGRAIIDWPYNRGGRQYVGANRPAAMYRADIYCADCLPFAYDEYTGRRVLTLTGEDA